VRCSGIAVHLRLFLSHRNAVVFQNILILQLIIINDVDMKFFSIIPLLYVLLLPCSLKSQGVKTDNDAAAGYFIINDAFYIHGDSSESLSAWTEQGLHVLFAPVNDSMVISIDVGGRDRMLFLGMAVAIDNPGFIASNQQAEFYRWIFVSHIKEGMHDACIHKEYVEKSFEKLGHRLYFINILFPDQTEFQFYGYRFTPDSQ
jgi:hypothetical protein